MTPSPFVVETAGLTKRFGGRTVVQDVELHVPRASAFGYLGPNGARPISERLRVQGSLRGLSPFQEDLFS